MGRGRQDRERGAAAVEFALILPILLLFVMGTIEWGWFFFTHQRVVNAAREGARAGTLLPPTATDAAVQSAAEAAAEEYLTAVGLTATGVAADPNYGMDDGSEGVQLTITYPYTSLTQFPGISSLVPSTFTYVSVMRKQ